MEEPYPLTYSVDYPDRKLNRLSTFFRIFWLIPIAIVAVLLTGGGGGQWSSDSQSLAITGGGVTTAPLVLMLLFRKKYPRWWFDWNLELSRFGNRILAYAVLMDDQYPSTDEHQSVHLDFEYPNAEELGRGMPLVKWFLAIPHYIVLVFLVMAAYVILFVAWFAILFTGRFPRGMFEFIEGVIRWFNRVSAYTSLLITDRYPPFSLK
jgi:hypothetical protein